MGTITHIEITGADPKASAQFYASAFDWQITASPFIDEYFTADTGSGEGIDAAIMSDRYQSQRTILWIEVPNIEVTRAKVLASGGSVGDVQQIPGQGLVGYVTDPHGVVIGLKQPN